MVRSGKEHIIHALASNESAFDELISWLGDVRADEQQALNELACAALYNGDLLSRARIAAGRVEMLKDLITRLHSYKHNKGANQ